MQIKNLTNSPFTLVDKDSKRVMLPARGTVDIEPHPMHENLYRQVGYFEIAEAEVEAEKPSKNPSTERTQARKDGKDGGGKK